jgi:hypothetical protein
VGEAACAALPAALPSHPAASASLRTRCIASTKEPLAALAYLRPSLTRAARFIQLVALEIAVEVLL